LKKFARLEGDKIVEYEFKYYDDARHAFDKMKLDFVKENHINSDKDRFFLSYCESLDHLLIEWENKLPIKEECTKCNEDDRIAQGFCRCEWRNIRLAKQRRNMHSNSTRR
jgi:hypothetical protein